MRNQTSDTLVILVLSGEDRVCAVFLTGHVEWVLLEILARLRGAVNVVPCLGIDTRDLVWSNSDGLAIGGVEGLDTVYESAILHGTHIGEASEFPE